MKVVIGSDHAGYAAKEALKKHLISENVTVEDVGTYDEKDVDYTDYAYDAAKKAVSGRYDFGIVICGTGIGASIAANKVKGVRCALVYSVETAKLAKEHNNANVIAFGSRFEKIDFMVEALDTFVNATFQGGRHARRVEKLKEIEEREAKEYGR